MGYKPKHSMKCECGSGKKYKNCCKPKHDRAEAERELFVKLINGELPFRAEIESKDGSEQSMVMQKFEVVEDGKSRILLDDKVVLSTGSSKGENITSSKATLSVPQNRLIDSTITTSGSASVKNEGSKYKLSLGGTKSLKIKDDRGLFASFKIKMQRDTEIEYFDLYFGEKGKPELVTESGEKDRPHLAFYPDGNYQYIRLAGYKCSLENSLIYDAESKEIYPSRATVSCEEFGIALEIYFDFERDSNTVVLKHAKFVAV